MFNLEDYYTTTTTLDHKSQIRVSIELNKNKINEDVKLFKEILQNLEKLIGPYTIKVCNKKIKFKKNKNNT